MGLVAAQVATSEPEPRRSMEAICLLLIPCRGVAALALCAPCRKYCTIASVGAWVPSRQEDLQQQQATGDCSCSRHWDASPTGMRPPCPFDVECRMSKLLTLSLAPSCKTSSRASLGAHTSADRTRRTMLGKIHEASRSR